MRLLPRLLVATAVLLASGCTTTTGPAPSEGRVAGSPRPAPSATAQPVLHHGWPSHPRVSRLPGRLPHPLAREAVSAAVDGASAVVAGGLLQAGTTTASTYTLDLRTGRSTPLPDLATAVHDTAGSVLSGRATVIGGGNTSEQSVVQARRHGRWRVVGHLPAARSDVAAVPGRGGTTIVVGGYDGSTPAVGAVLGTRDGRRWRTVGHLPVPVRYAAAAVVGTTIWVFGGEVGGRLVDTVQTVDLATGRARVAGHLPVPLGHSAVVHLDGHLLLAGGRTSSSTVTARLWWVRTHPFRLHPAGRLPTPLADSAAVTAGGSAYLVGGETPTWSDRVLRLGPRP